MRAVLPLTTIVDYIRLDKQTVSLLQAESLIYTKFFGATVTTHGATPASG